jgi:hypothetical protein
VEETCLGTVGELKGTYTINGFSLILERKKQKKEGYILAIDSQLHLLTQNQILETKQLTIDLLIREPLLKPKDIESFIKKHLLHLSNKKKVG